MSEQIVKVLQDDKQCNARYGTSRIGNVLIVGRRGSGKTVLAVNIVKAIQKSRRMKQGKVAIVKADAFNQKNASEIVEKLHGGALVIERASKLKRNTIDDLCELMEGQTGELLVVLEDERKPMERLLKEYPNFAKKFTSRIDLPVFINDELVTFGQTYAKENGYKIDEMGILALYSDIDVLQREEKVVTVATIKAIIDDAIENANRITLKKMVKKLFGKTTDESDRIILKEEDFR
jgi:SpoVK/Ycf46/Vps4 family AAA+-type ATPase